ncbi:hypothetical protein [Spirosoma gilvum]
MKDYKDALWRELKPVDILIEKIDQWLSDHPDKSNTAAVFLSQFIVSKNEPRSIYTPDPHQELRNALNEIHIFLNAILQTVVDIWQPLLSDTTQQLQKIENSCQTVESVFSEPDSQIRKFNDVPSEIARKYFMQLETQKNKQGEFFLTEEQVNDFICIAFGGKVGVEKITINARTMSGGGDKRRVVALFHIFYRGCTTHLTGRGKLDKFGTAEKYVKLLTDHFDNWTFEEVAGNFRSDGEWLPLSHFLPT